MVSKARALSAKSLLSVEPSLRMSMASCLELSKKLFWMVLVTERAPSFSFPAYKWTHTHTNKKGLDKAILIIGYTLALWQQACTFQSNHRGEEKEEHIREIEDRFLNWPGIKPASRGENFTDWCVTWFNLVSYGDTFDWFLQVVAVNKSRQQIILGNNWKR